MKAFHNQQSWKRLWLTSSIIPLILIAEAGAQAGDLQTQADGHRLETIVVTAQKKEQSLQDVPASVEAFDTEQLELRRIRGIEDIGTFVPGLYATPSAADSGGVRAYIRGIGTSDPQIGLDARVALYLDGVYLGKTQGIALDIPDLARVEILSGPQGTLYGRNTVAGAVNIVSQTPETGVYSGRLNAEYGSFNQMTVSGSLNVPLSEIVAIRVAGLYETRDGWVDNSGLGDDFGGTERSGWRVSLGVEPNADFNFILAADYLQSENQGLFYQAVPGSASQRAPFASAITPVSDRLDNIATSFPAGTGKVKNMGVSFTANYTFDAFNSQHDAKFILGYRQADAKRFSALAAEANPVILASILKADLDRNQANGIFSIISAFQAVPILLAGTNQGSVRADFQNPFARPVTGLFFSPVNGSDVLDGHKQFSAELIFNGSFMDGRLDYTGGFYFFDEDTADTRRVDQMSSPAPGDIGSIPFLLGALEPIGTGLGALNAMNSIRRTLSQNPAQNPGRRTLSQNSGRRALSQAIPSQFQRIATTEAQTAANILDKARDTSSAPMSIQTEALAVYTQWTYRVTDRFRVTGGLRFSDESRSAIQQPVSLLFEDTTSLLGNEIDSNKGSISFNNLDPALILEFDVNDDVMLYGRYSESFRSGGFNQTANRARISGRQYGDDFIFDAEEIRAYEAGFKGDFADGRLRLSGAIYYYQFENEQAVDTDPDQLTQRVIFNRDSEFTGFELTALWAASDHLNLSANYARTDGDIDDVDVQFSQRSKTVPGVSLQSPKNAYNFGLDYRRPVAIGAKGELFATLSYAHRDKTHVTPENELTARDLLSGRIGIDYTLAGGNVLNVSVWGENLMDEKYTVDSVPLGSLIYDVVAYGPPRTIGVSVGLEF